MSTNYDAGRISKRSFAISTLTLLAVCVISACVRFYIRLRIQKQFSIDDYFLVFGLCCMISAQVLFFFYANGLYFTEELDLMLLDFAQLPDDWMETVFSFQARSTAGLVLSWFSIISVKFSFLFLFRKLVDRLPYMMMYWWFATVLNFLICVYGIVVYFVACPYFDNVKYFTCSPWQAINFSLSQMILDIVGDLLILVIPIRIITQIRVRWTQKLALSLSLCLTIIIICITIVRASGLHRGSKVDVVWEIFWQMTSAEVGLIMVAATAFRTLFVANSQANEKFTKSRSWHTTKRFLLRLVSPRSWRRSREDDLRNFGDVENHLDDLPGIPGGNITGLQSFIRGNGRTVFTEPAIGEENEDAWPLSPMGRY